MDLSSQTQAIAARFAHELSGPMGSAGRALELAEEQMAVILTKAELKLYKAGLVGGSIPSARDRKSASRTAKIFELGFAHRCLHLGLESARGILNNLRDWGKITDNVRPVSLEDSLKTAWMLVGLEHKNLSVSWNLKDPHGSSFKGNPHALMQVWMNIFRNAVQVNPKGCRVTVTLHHKLDTWEISIANDGKRLPASLDIFAGGKSGRIGGTGVGLRLSREIIEAHGGTITAENNKQGKGVVFTIKLKGN